MSAPAYFYESEIVTRDVGTPTAVCTDHTTTEDNIYVAALQMHARFTSFALRYVDGRADAEDVVQDFYLRVVRNARSLRRTEHLQSWFYRILHSALTDHFRRDQRRRRFMRDAQAISISAVGAGDATDCGCLLDMLTLLRPPYAAMIQHIDLDGQSVERTAALLGITPNNVRVRLFRARRALRTKLLLRSATCPARALYGCCVQSAGRDWSAGRISGRGIDCRTNSLALKGVIACR